MYGKLVERYLQLEVEKKRINLRLHSKCLNQIPLSERRTQLSPRALLRFTRKALLLFEKSHPPILYVPKYDIFERHYFTSSKISYCSHKGEENYWSLSINNEIVLAAVWKYATPTSDVVAIKNHDAFSSYQSKGHYYIYDTGNF